MKFTKMQGTGNDYVYVNCFQETVPNPGEVAKRISDRHFGIGSDGLILIKPSKTADFEMEMYNSDGSLGAMCGNGIRCVAKYVYDYGLTDKTRITVATGSGIKTLDLTVEDGKVTLVKVDMGAPILEAERIPADVEKLAGERISVDTAKLADERIPADVTKLAGGRILEAVPGSETEAGTARQSGGKAACSNSSDGVCVCAAGERPIIGRMLDVNGQKYSVTCVSMGNPHCVTPVDDVDGLKIEAVGPEFEHHPAFPDRVNTEFIRVLDRNTVQMRVWERGAGETWACGTGACAVAVACILNGWTEDAVTVKLRGGDLRIQWDREKNTVFMTGPAEAVFDGEIWL